MLSKLQGKRGFTLIELIIVVVILGILILIVLAATRGDKNKASDASLKADLSRMAQAMEDCHDDAGYKLALDDTCIVGKFDTGRVPTDVTLSNATASTYTLTVTLSNGDPVTAAQKQ